MSEGAKLWKKAKDKVEDEEKTEEKVKDKVEDEEKTEGRFENVGI